MTAKRASVVVVVFGTAGAVHPAPSHAQAHPDRLLDGVAEATSPELENFDAGEAFVKTLDANDRRELAQVYAVRVDAPVAFLLAQIRAGHLLLDDANGSEMRGFFSRPPAEADLDELTLSRGAVRDLEDCRPRDCDLKLPAEMIERIHAEVDWSGPSAAADANRAFRQALQLIMAAYMEQGDAAGLTYDDKPEPLAVRDGFERLLVQAREIGALDADFAHYLAEYPNGGTSGVEDMFTWTIEDLGIKSLVSLNHIAFKQAGRYPGVSLIGVKRVYSGHYFQAGLRVIVVGPTSTDSAAADSYVFVVDRRRFDGELGGLRRTATERRLERHAESVLSSLKDRVETAYDR